MMPSIGNIVVKRVIEHKLLPPVLEPIVRSQPAVIEQAPNITHLVPPALLGAGGKTETRKQSAHGLSGSVVISDSVVRVKTSGVTGISFTQTSFTFESYTITGAPVTKSLSDTITISEPLAVQRSKTRVIADSDATETSETLDIVRTKTRALAETVIISENITGIPQTHKLKTITETDAISENITTFKESKRLQTETVSESGTVDLLLPGVVKTLSESVTISEGVIFEVTHAGGTNITKTLDETTPISDAMDRQSGLIRALTEVQEVTEDLDKLTTLIQPNVKTLTETTEESHTVRMVLTKNRGLSETLTIIG